MAETSWPTRRSADNCINFSQLENDYGNSSRVTHGENDHDVL